MVWPIPEGRTLSHSMALITVLFPLLVLWEGNAAVNEATNICALGFRNEVTSLEVRGPVLCSGSSAQAGRAGARSLRKWMNRRLAYACEVLLAHHCKPTRKALTVWSQHDATYLSLARPPDRLSASLREAT